METYTALPSRHLYSCAIDAMRFALRVVIGYGQLFYG